MTRVGAAVALVLAWAGAAGAQPRLGPVQTRRLDNGLTVILAPVPADRGTISVRLRVHAGSSANPREAPGLAHLVEHMVATVPWDRAGDVFDHACLRAPRVSCNASTAPDATDFYMTLPADHLQLALWAHAQFLAARPVISSGWRRPASAPWSGTRSARSSTGSPTPGPWSA